MLDASLEGRHSRSAVLRFFVRRSCLRGGEHNPARFYLWALQDYKHMLVSSCSAPGASNRRRREAPAGVKLRGALGGKSGATFVQ